MTRVLLSGVDDHGPGGIYSLVRSVIARCPEGVHFDFAALEPFEQEANQTELEQRGCLVRYLGRGRRVPSKWVAWYRGTQRMLRENSYDFLHLHSDVAHRPLLVAMAAVQAGFDKQRIIVHAHASDVDGSCRPIKRLLHRLCSSLLPHFCGRYVACSDRAARWMFPKAVPGKVTIIRNGIDLARFRYDSDLRCKAREKLGLDSEAFLIGHVGRFSYQKNHPFLLRLFARLLTLRHNARLLLVGAGNDMEAAVSLAEQLGIDNRVIFYGTTQDTVPLFCAMDAFVLPSNFEGLPIVGVEAQALGLNCLMSDKVTTMAALTPLAQFLPIGNGDELRWAQALAQMATPSDKQRSDDNQLLRQKGYDLENTIDDFLAIYKA